MDESSTDMLNVQPAALKSRKLKPCTGRVRQLESIRWVGGLYLFLLDWAPPQTRARNAKSTRLASSYLRGAALSSRTLWQAARSTNDGGDAAQMQTPSYVETLQGDANDKEEPPKKVFVLVVYMEDCSDASVEDTQDNRKEKHCQEKYCAHVVACSSHPSAQTQLRRCPAAIKVVFPCRCSLLKSELVAPSFRLLESKDHHRSDDEDWEAQSLNNSDEDVTSSGGERGGDVSMGSSTMPRSRRRGRGRVGKSGVQGRRTPTWTQTPTPS
eukprot:747854-Hanusia_phi.AAC.5